MTLWNVEYKLGKLETENEQLKSKKDAILTAMEDDIRKISRENGQLMEDNTAMNHDIRNILAERDDIIGQSKMRDKEYLEVIKSLEKSKNAVEMESSKYEEELSAKVCCNLGMRRENLVIIWKCGSIKI